MRYSPSRRLGQHFLKNKEKLRKIAASLDVERGDIVIEIGPGHGELTKILIAAPDVKVIAIEKDKDLVKLLEEKFQIPNDKFQINSKIQIPRIEFIEGDALKIIPQLPKIYNLSPTTYKLVGNIPYYITGKLLRTIGELKEKPKIAVLTVQKEVAERIAAKPPKTNLLAASVQIWAEAEIIDYIPKRDFQPPPKVDSAIIRLRIRNNELGIMDNYYRLIKALFKQPRKTILNNLSVLKSKKEFLLILEKLGINPGARPQNLALEEIKKLSEAVSD